MSIDLTLLDGIFGELCGIYGRLLELSHIKHKAIIENDTEGISAAVQAETRLLYESRDADKKRAAFVSKAAKTLGVAEDEITFSRLLCLASPDEADRLSALHGQLGALLASLKQLNRQNLELLKTHVEYTEMMINLIVGPEDPINTIYGAGGVSDEKKRHTAGLFDTQI